MTSAPEAGRAIRSLGARCLRLGRTAAEPGAWPAWPDLAAGLRDRILSLAASPISPALVHGDRHPGNVQVDGETVRLLDWSDAAISHPFVDLAVYLRHVPITAERRRTVDAYLEPWAAGYGRAALERAAAEALVVGAVYQVATYLALMPALDLRDRWQYEHAAPRWLPTALRPLQVAPASST